VTGRLLLGRPLTWWARLGVLVVTPVLLLVALLSWALSSPVGASPDDDFHTVSIWCETERDNICEPSGEADSRLVHPDFGATSSCFAFRPDVSAACQAGALDEFEPDAELVETQRGNFERLYPPVFYWVMSRFAGSEMIPSVLIMRGLNAVIYLSFLSAVIAAVPRWLRPPTVLGAVATAVPLGMFLIPSTNPSSWALLSAATFWVSLLGVASSRGRRRLVLVALTLLSAVIGAGARADSAYFMVLAVLAVVVLTIGRKGARWLFYGTAAGALVVAVGLFLTSSQGGQLAGGLPHAPDPARTPEVLLTANFLNVPRLWAGMFGDMGGLGWLDTPMPAAVPVLGLAVFGGVVFWGLSRSSLAKGLVVVGAAAALWLVPLVMLLQSGAFVGEQVQSRYILPMAVILAGVAALATRGRAPRLSGLQAGAVVAALTIANSAALHTNMRRYITGSDHQAWNLDFDAEWWWPALPGPNSTWLVGTVAFAAGLAGLAVLYLWRPAGWWDETPEVLDGDVTTTRVAPGLRRRDRRRGGDGAATAVAPAAGADAPATEAAATEAPATEAPAPRAPASQAPAPQAPAARGAEQDDRVG